MIINGKCLLAAAPIKNMERCKMRSGNVTYGLSEAGYDIRVKQQIHFFPGLNNHRYTYIKGDGHPIQKSGSFALASSIEEFQMPSDLVGVVHDKSSWARHGLSVFNTVIEPGFQGFLTLELVYHGPGELTIPAGSGIAQVVFHRTAEHRYYEGRYNNQENKPVPAKPID